VDGAARNAVGLAAGAAAREAVWGNGVRTRVAGAAVAAVETGRWAAVGWAAHRVCPERSEVVGEGTTQRAEREGAQAAMACVEVVAAVGTVAVVGLESAAAAAAEVAADKGSAGTAASAAEFAAGRGSVGTEEVVGPEVPVVVWGGVGSVAWEGWGEGVAATCGSVRTAAVGACGGYAVRRLRLGFLLMTPHHLR
jgi:hypothetical protein